MIWGTVSNGTIHFLIVVLGREKRENEEGKIVEETLAKKFLNLV